MGEPRSESASATPGHAPAASERRRTRRLKLAQAVRVCPADPRYEEEVRATVNFSRDGLYFTTSSQHYYVGMHVDLVFPYREGDPVVRTSVGCVVRLDRRAGDRWGVAIKFLLN